MTSIWIINQGFKPDVGYDYGEVFAINPDPGNGIISLGYHFYRENLNATYFETISGLNRIIIDDYYEIMSFAAIPRLFPLGKFNVELPGVSSINLNANPYNFGNKRIDHSGQFSYTNMREKNYWWTVLLSMDLGERIWEY